LPDPVQFISQQSKPQVYRNYHRNAIQNNSILILPSFQSSVVNWTRPNINDTEWRACSRPRTYYYYYYYNYPYSPYHPYYYY